MAAHLRFRRAPHRAFDDAFTAVSDFASSYFLQRQQPCRKRGIISACRPGIEARFGNVVASLSKQRLATTPLLSNKRGFRVSENNRLTGKLKFFRSDRAAAGYGFIARDGVPLDDFIHISSVRDSGIRPESLEDNVTRFSYELVEDPKNRKLKAVNLKIID
jgi:cold shock CspA family protein